MTSTMLAARDQENRVFSHQAGAVAKQQNLQPKTPGARFPKTPLKVPLNDENATRVLGGKSVLGDRPGGGNENIRTVGRGAKGAEKSNLVTPLGMCIDSQIPYLHLSSHILTVAV